MNKRHEIQFKSYDRLFPSQDTMPRGGLGNLIALPLQKAARENTNSEFVDENFILVATGHFIGEGFDEPRLDTLFLAMPISWKGTLQQYAGRLHRLFETKKEVRIYDYVDIQVKMLEKCIKNG